MEGIELLTLGLVMIIAIGVVVRGFLSRIKELREEEPIDAINDPVLRDNLRRIREQKDDIEELRMLLGALETSTIEREKKSREKLYTLRNDFSRLQDLALWMTGCGYDFLKHHYYYDNKYLLTKGVEGTLEERIEKGMDKLSVKEKTYTPEEAKEEPLREVPCPVCDGLTIVGLCRPDISKPFEIAELRYCPICDWKDIPIEGSDVEEKRVGLNGITDPLLIGDEMHLKGEGR